MIEKKKKIIILVFVSVFLALGPLLAYLGVLGIIQLRTGLLIFSIYMGIGAITYWTLVVLSLLKKEHVDQWFNLFIVTAVFLMLLLYLIFNWNTI